MINGRKAKLNHNKSSNRKYNDGFSLLEVLISVMLLSVFGTMYVTSQGNNILSSSSMREEALLKRLCEQVISEIVVHPPQFSTSLTLAPETKRFEQSEYANYEYTIQYKELEIPDLMKFSGKGGTSEDNSKEESSSSNNDTDDRDKDEDGNSNIEKTIVEQFQKNIKTMIYQVSVTVKNKQTNFSYTLSTWLHNTKAKVQVGI